MSNFTLLLFAWDDQVLGVQSLQCPDTGTARRIAETAIADHPQAAGWQLWHGGHKVLATFPASDGERPALRVVRGGAVSTG